ncbi:energy-coupling factor ABC transporter permease [Demequina lutea]|uniref:Cobalt/nickel transport system permease protein n=1 Tax=Demequina lutea TaxID=431489 RepID=A0A7Y9ZC37_9MICO|nr:energy-coupling factor ABC transporter permease [Demequina lutea]NYI42682.1 cobalt/nickel transport system permease protein [Demequina lutea]
MHMPDGVLNPTTLVVAGAASVGALAWSMHEVRRGRPRLGMALGGAAGLLIAHLADVPLYGPYTAHLIGGTLLAIAIGPWLAMMTMATALALEAFLWHDGGTATLGANMLVMGVVGILVGYGAYRGALAVASRLHRDAEEPSALAKASAAAAGAWLSVMASALTLVSLVSVGGVTTLGAVTGAPEATLGDLLPRYAAWGLLEAFVTGVAVAAGLAWGRSVVRIEGAAEIGQRVPVLSR